MLKEMVTPTSTWCGWTPTFTFLAPKPTLNDEIMPERGLVQRRARGEPLVTEVLSRRVTTIKSDILQALGLL